MSESKVRCPYCGSVVSTYIPKGGDGSGLRLRKHNVERVAGRLCEANWQTFIPSELGEVSK